ncbi:MAG: efflux RND transporter periplasmic adaptor subunit [Candidatus Entotheonellia bacterium]
MIRYFLIVMAMFIVAGCGSDYSATGAPPRADREAVTPRLVHVTPAAQDTVARGTVVTGTLAAEDQVALSFKVAGRLSEIAVDLGSRVRKGQTIAQLDPTDFRLRVRQAEAALQQARARLGLSPDGTHDRVDPEHTPLVRQAHAMLDEARRSRDRMVQLWERQLIALAELDAATATLQVAEGRYQDAIEEVRNRQAVLAERRSELAIARQQLLDSELKAPLDGAVRQRHVSAGEYLAAGSPIVTVVRIHPLRLRLAVPERMAADVRVGQPVNIKVEGDRAVYRGRVVRLSPAISEEDRTLLVEAEVPNEHGQLRPGAFAEAEIVTAAEERAVFVPASSIVTFAGIEKVMTVRDGLSLEKRVQTGRRLGDRVEIVEGLNPEELVVVEPGNLVGGQPVTVSP